MIAPIRKSFNDDFQPAHYEGLVDFIKASCPDQLDFKIAETPIFMEADFKNKMLQTCAAIIDLILEKNFLALTEKAIPTHLNVPNENPYPDFLVFDFGVCQSAEGNIEPQLIEMQGFPSIFAFEVLLDEAMKKFYALPEQLSPYFSGLDKNSYLSLLKNILLDNEGPEAVILLEILPHQQKTRIDFYCTAEYFGISTVCLTELIKEGKNLYYQKGDKKIQIKRIYNRIIFDDLAHQSPEIQAKGKILLEDLDLTWVSHPNWFYRVSKYILPFIHHPYVPPTQFVNAIKILPKDLENYVLKPLFSFAGQGVHINIKPEDITELKDPENWILQKKVHYAETIATQDISAKAEIRIFYFWEKNATRPIPTMNLARLSKGEMIGVRYNKDKTWVGGSIAYFDL